MKIVERSLRRLLRRSALIMRGSPCRSPGALDIALDDAARSAMPAGFACGGQAGDERLEPLEALLERGAASSASGRSAWSSTRRSSGRRVALRRSRSAAPRPACRACRRRRLHRRPSPRAGVRRAAVARCRRNASAVPSTTRGACEHVAGDGKSLIGDVTAPVDALAAPCMLAGMPLAPIAKLPAARRVRLSPATSSPTAPRRVAPLCEQVETDRPEAGIDERLGQRAHRHPPVRTHTAHRRRRETGSRRRPRMHQLSSRATIDHVMGVPVRSRGVGA